MELPMGTTQVTKDLPSRPQARVAVVEPAPAIGENVVSGRIEHGSHRTKGQSRPLFEPAIVKRAIVESFRKLDPRHQVRNPVMFVVEVGSVLTRALVIQALGGH